MQENIKDGMGSKPMGLVHSIDEEHAQRICRWSEKDGTRREQDGSVHSRDEKSGGRLLEMAEGNYYELRFE